MNSLLIKINGIALRFFFPEDAPVKVMDVTRAPYDKSKDVEGRLMKWSRLVEVQVSGLNHDDHHGNKYTGTNPGVELRYHSHTRSRTPLGQKLEIKQTGGGVAVVSHLQFLGKLPAFRSWTTVANSGSEPILMEYVSSFALAGISRGGTESWDKKMILNVPRNHWCGECQWHAGTLPDYGLDRIYSPAQDLGFSLGRVSISNQGSWSTLGHLPMGILENKETGRALFWQIEHNGSWQWEIGDIAYELYLRVSGPTYRESLWSRKLAPGEIFESVPATVGIVDGGTELALRILTQARRIIRRPHPDMVELPVIFNDYMNCLMADPSEEKLIPVINRAAEAGCEYFVIDGGWYAPLDDPAATWWSAVGEWEPSETRFPRGLEKVMDHIREKGMIPGIWLEIEVIGIHCPLARKLPDSWFFQRNGKRLMDNGRYQLDFRNPEVRAHAHEIVERMIRAFGVGYIKMDYNINAGPGTDFQADSPGDGLLEYNRDYLRWVTEILDRHPTLIIENCGSGGLRMDYAQLAVHSIQSTSDQTDYRLNAVIAAAAPSAVTPEQAGVWTYPLREGDEEETIFNMVNAMLMRIHQSGRIHELSASRHALVKEGIALYKSIRKDIPGGLPFWPLGLPRFGDEWAALGLDCGSTSYLAVWRLGGKSKQVTLPLRPSPGMKISCIYPASKSFSTILRPLKTAVEVTLPKPYCARLLKITHCQGL